MTEVHTLGPGVDPSAAIDAAARALSQGLVCALPTDTVYGFAARATAASAISAIFDLKGRPSNKAFPYLLADAADLETFVNHVPPRAAKLVARFWPGPLTLVLGAEGQTVALRVPEHGVTRRILKAAGGLVVATSANRSGEPGAASARELLAWVDSRIAVVVDAGDAPIGRESSIAQVNPAGAFAVRRVGALPGEVLRETATLRVLFVCTGNTCRSPLAAALAPGIVNTPLGELERPFSFRSAGIGAVQGDAASPGALMAAAERGYDLRTHHSTPLREVELSGVDAIFTMTASHRSAVRAHFPGFTGPIVGIDPDGDVPDPFGSPVASYRATIDTLLRLMPARLAALEAGRL